MEKNLILVSGAVVFKESRGNTRWLITKQTSDGVWEIPKIIVRRGESSVRAAIRMMGEKGGMSTRVIEEVGRAGGVTSVNNRTFPQRYLYYLMLMKYTSGESVGFADYQWLDYNQALKRLSSKREKAILRRANIEYKNWKRSGGRKKYEEEDEFEEEFREV